MNVFAPYLRPGAPAFAVLYRPGAPGADGKVELVAGDIVKPASIAGLAASFPPAPAGGRHQMLALVPFRQITERGFTVVDDGAELVGLRVRHQQAIDRAEAIAALPGPALDIDMGGFDISDEDFAKRVQVVVDQEIGRGEGSNFVVPRTYVARIRDFALDKAAAIYRNLLIREAGTWWTFLVHTGDTTFVGASPERHVWLEGDVAGMNPISGTHVFPPSGPDLPALETFLADRKETDELAMVLEEELKMMAGICAGGVHATGPFLKTMGHVAHTEYFIEGRTRLSAPEVLRRTMFSPAVTGSPLESACRVIARREPQGRGYYGGVLALFGTDGAGRAALDSAIFIRTARIDRTGELSLPVGATVVRHSDPDTEAAETSAKAAGLLAALRSGATAERRTVAGLDEIPGVRAALNRRNENLASFWLTAGNGEPAEPGRAGSGIRVVVIDAEDSFTAMLGHQIRALGPRVTIRRFDQPVDPDSFDLLVLGPGPGDPRRHDDPRIQRLADLVDAQLAAGRPFLAVCLSHQILCQRLGLRVSRLDQPLQGTQREISLFGTTARLGFYNSFAACSDRDQFTPPGFAAPVKVGRDAATGEVHLLSGPGFVSCQFHAESVLSPDGMRFLDAALAAAHAGYLPVYDRGFDLS
jgi:2-amino-4-deoxychorismate synthase